MLAKSIRADSSGSHALWSGLRDQARGACAAMRSSERAELRRIMDVSINTVLERDIIPWRQYEAWIRFCD